MIGLARPRHRRRWLPVSRRCMPVAHGLHLMGH
jgi:hypothetical protein